ncbi:hypothetical protein HMPREF0201_02084 [Cedecea davisae DSM 4568]|uniref:Uncharacterized protein n=1 Tax=Cedecea davisae DSM 4568 TaxID=566551 RepID=S3JUL9_9ENTR|nr:hypothetical protein HMPREF0201_02084 [Cedecea davisae DSM 4568]
MKKNTVGLKRVSLDIENYCTVRLNLHHSSIATKRSGNETAKCDILQNEWIQGLKV